MGPIRGSPKRKKKRGRQKKASPMRLPRSPRIKEMKRKQIHSTSEIMKALDPNRTWQDVYDKLRGDYPTLFTQKDRKRVERWAFTEDLKQQNRGTPVKGRRSGTNGRMRRWTTRTNVSARWPSTSPTTACLCPTCTSGRGCHHACGDHEDPGQPAQSHAACHRERGLAH